MPDDSPDRRQITQLTSTDIADSDRIQQLLETCHEDKDEVPAPGNSGEQDYSRDHIEDDLYEITPPDYSTATEAVQQQVERLEDAYRAWDRLTGHISTDRNCIYRYGVNPARQIVEEYDFTAEALYAFLDEHTLKGGRADGWFLTEAIEATSDEVVRIPDLDVAPYFEEDQQTKEIHNDIYSDAKDGNIDVKSLERRDRKIDEIEEELAEKMAALELDVSGEPRKELEGVGMSVETTLIFEGYPGEDPANYADTVIFLDPSIETRSISTSDTTTLYSFDADATAEHDSLCVRNTVAPSGSLVTQLKERF